MVTDADIVEAIHQNEFTFFYQPKISLITGKIVGAEALIRWVKPDGRVIMPDNFIPLAESSQLIKQITRHMFPRLINDLLLLMDVDDSMSISFNASAKDFQDSVFALEMLEMMAASRLPAHAMQVELTETAMLEAGDAIRANIMLLIEAGIDLAMDDFGMGYSSLDTLSKWPFTTIKLDQGIVSRMMDSDKNSTIVESSVRMAHELSLSVVAEGVESNEQYQRLLEMGCGRIQGFWISHPLPLDQFIAFVKEDLRWSGIPIGLIHMATIDHVQWRRQLVSEIVKLAALPKDAPQRNCQHVSVHSCKSCRLGLWYYGAGQVLRDRQSFIELEQPHCKLHEIGSLLVTLVAEGADLEQLTPHLRELSVHSMSVLSKLQMLEDEGLIDMHASQGEWIAHSLHPSKLNGSAVVCEIDSVLRFGGDEFVN